MSLLTNRAHSSDRIRIDEMSDEQRKALVVTIVARMKAAYNVTKQKDLIAALGCQQSTASGWSSQGTIPWEMMDRCHHDTKCTVDWLLYGTSPAESDSDTDKAYVDAFKAIFEDVLLTAKEYEVIAQLQPNGFEKMTKELHRKLLKKFSV